MNAGCMEQDGGVIRTGWEFAAFCEIVGTYIDYRGRTPQKLGMDWGGGDFLALSANNVQMGRIALEKEAYFGSEELYRKWMRQGECAQGDILLTMEAPLGNVAQVPDDRKYILSQRVLLIKPNARISRDFLLHLMQGSQFQGSLEQNSTGSTAKGIQRAKLDTLEISFPRSTSEQSAIANALSDVDALLAVQDALIAKKRAIKQGAMQELLTGKRRLPGFSGDWEETRLGEFATFHKGKGLPKSAMSHDGPEPCVHYGELFTQYGETISETISRTKRLPGEFCSIANDVLMPTSDVTPRGLAKASCILVDDVVLGGDILVIRTNPVLVSGTFLSHVIRHEEEQVLRLVTGSTVFHLYGADMKKFTCKLPRILEQQAIVGILSDMGTEIADLETKRAKIAQLKQGMMQELLTGRIRLV